MDKHVRNAGWLNVALGVLNAGGGLFLLWGAWRGVDGGWMGAGVLARYYLGGILLIMALLYLAAGAGLLKAKRWAKSLAVVAGVLSILSFPIGTAIGVYTIWAVTRGGAGAALQ